MAIAVGDRLPDVTFKVMADDRPADRTTADVFAGKRVALFAVPGAYTPTCHKRHVPSFLENLDAFQAKGVDMVACVAVNDVHVLNVWSKDTGAYGKIEFLSDGNGDFTKAIGLELDARAGGLGIRSQRYAMLVEDGVVRILNVEDVPGTVDVSSASELLKAL